MTNPATNQPLGTLGSKSFKDSSWVFLGTPEIAVHFLEYLNTEFGTKPNVVVCNEDKPQGRKQILTPPPIKVWAEENDIEVAQGLGDAQLQALLEGYDFACVLAYNHILSSEVINTPAYGVVNIHPSLLPQLRGPAPIMQALLDDQKETGISLMLLDEGMDSGPIIGQAGFKVAQWSKNSLLEQTMAEQGALLFANLMPKYLSGLLIPEQQNHEQATYCRKFTKADMELLPTDEPYLKFRKYCAFEKPFFIHEDKRYVVTEATYLTPRVPSEQGEFVIEKVIPEGKKEQPFKQLAFEF